MASPADFPANFSFIIGLKQHLICGNGDEVKGRETKQNNLFEARPGHRHAPSARASRSINRLAVFRTGVRSRLFGRPRQPAFVDETHGDAAHSGENLLGREPLLSVFLRRGVLPAQARLRSLVANALAPAQLRTYLGRVMRTSAVRLQAKRVCRSS
jgi:hypothetical protein